MATLKIFVSHSHHDDALCRQLVADLRTADTDVWYDEHNLGSGQLIDTIERELRDRPVFIVILSPPALSSPWVRDETKWAYNLYRRDQTQRIILPVLAQTIREQDLWLFLEDFKRIEAPGIQPYAPDEVSQRVMQSLSLTPRGIPQIPVGPQPTETADDLIARAKALRAQNKHYEALPLLQKATELAPDNYETWVQFGFTLDDLHIYHDALISYDRGIQLNPTSAWAYQLKGVTFRNLKRYEEALAANEQALTLFPTYVLAWYGKGSTFRSLNRNE
jgi:tetratricopeptide (TPR) repeat protein